MNIADERVTKTQAANVFTVCQNEDETLNHYRGLAVPGSSEFIIDKGRLYKNTPATVHSLHEKSFVVPRECTDGRGSGGKVSNHAGRKATQARIMPNFWWPKLTKDVMEFVKSCPEYQEEYYTDKPIACPYDR